MALALHETIPEELLPQTTKRVWGNSKTWAEAALTRAFQLAADPVHEHSWRIGLQRLTSRYELLRQVITSVTFAVRAWWQATEP